MHQRAKALIVALALSAGLLATLACGGGASSDDATPEATSTAGQRAPTSSPGVTQTATATVDAPSPPPPPALTQTPQGEPPAASPTPPPPAPAQPSPTPAPPPPPPPPPPPAGGTVFLTFTAAALRFSPTSASAPVGADVTVTLQNDDEGVAHDLVVFAPGGGSAGSTPIITGGSASFSFVASAAGRYSFKCSVHPQQMTGAIFVE